MTHERHDHPAFATSPAISILPPSKRCWRSFAARVADAPLFTPVMPRTGKPFSVRMTNLGALGWVSDRAGYRYQPTHPDTGKPWPPIPEMVLDIWREVSGYPHDPEACLVNFYKAGAKMGLHRDEDEEDFAAPVVSISLGDTAVFRIGGPERGGKTQSLKLASGDVLVMGGQSASATTASTGFSPAPQPS